MATLSKIIGAAAVGTYFGFVMADQLRSYIKYGPYRKLVSKDHVLYQQDSIRTDPEHSFDGAESDRLYCSSSKAEIHPTVTECDGKCKEGFDILDKCFPGMFVQEKKFIAANRSIPADFKVTSCTSGYNSMYIIGNMSKEHQVFFDIKKMRNKNPAVSFIRVQDNVDN